MTLLEKGVPPLSHRDELAEKILLTILGNTTSSVKRLLTSSPEAKAELAKCCLEMADAMIDCQNAEKEE